jgi:site-specific recombinase XerD
VDLRMGNIRFPARPRTCARIIKITPHLRQTLEKAKKISEFVFTCPYHEPLNQNKFDRLVKNFKLEGDFRKQWTPCDLGYSFAYNFLQKGGTIEALQVVMGHHSPKETAKRFEHFLPKVN